MKPLLELSVSEIDSEITRLQHVDVQSNKHQTLQEAMQSHEEMITNLMEARVWRIRRIRENSCVD